MKESEHTFFWYVILKSEDDGGNKSNRILSELTLTTLNVKDIDVLSLVMWKRISEGCASTITPLFDNPDCVFI